jgi:hypothetical protein
VLGVYSEFGGSYITAKRGVRVKSWGFMQPKKVISEAELFRSRLDQMLDMDHALVRLSQQIHWAAFEERFGTLYVDKVGRPGLSIRLLVRLTYLSRMYDLGDEVMVAIWYDGEMRIEIVDRRKLRSRTKRKWRKQRAAIEPLIGHLKSDHRLDRNVLKGVLGDQINAPLSGCGRNLKKLLRGLLGLCFRRDLPGLLSLLQALREHQHRHPIAPLRPSFC